MNLPCINFRSCVVYWLCELCGGPESKRSEAQRRTSGVECVWRNAIYNNFGAHYKRWAGVPFTTTPTMTEKASQSGTANNFALCLGCCPFLSLFALHACPSHSLCSPLLVSRFIWLASSVPRLVRLVRTPASHAFIFGSESEFSIHSIRQSARRNQTLTGYACDIAIISIAQHNVA